MSVTASDIDLTPPVSDFTPDAIQYLYENFSRIRALITVLSSAQGVTGVFHTTDGKTVTVTDGVITSIV